MPVVTFVFGLCGVGKTYVADKMKEENQGIQVLDEGFSNPPSGSSLSPQKYNKLQEYLRSGMDCVVVEATLFCEDVRKEVERYVSDIPNIDIKWIAFEPDLETANHNCMHRKNKGDGPGHVRINTGWKQYYTIPENATRKSIHKVECNGREFCPVCHPICPKCNPAR